MADIALTISTPTLTLILVSATSLAVAAGPMDWPSWRGPQDRGSVETGDYPETLDESSRLWQVPLPGKGCSTPIVLDDRIFVTAPVEGHDALLAFDQQGRQQWSTAFGPEVAGKHRNGSGSNASPVTDGNAVFTYFKSGTLAALELDGSIRWQTNLVDRYGADTLFWDHGTSPVVTEKHVVMTRMHHGESWLAAFDKASGELAWKVTRNYVTETENDHGYTTPLVIDFRGRPALLVWGAEHLTLHDPSDGKVVWECGGFNPQSHRMWPAIATPVLVEDIVVVAFGRNDRRQPRLFGVRLPVRGELTAPCNHLWKRDDVGTFVPSPVAYQDRVFLVGDKGQVDCIVPATGNTIWSHALPRSRFSYYASPLIAAGQLYAAREDGVVYVAKISSDAWELLSENDMGESVIGSPVPSGNRLLIRGEKHLFCWGKN